MNIRHLLNLWTNLYTNFGVRKTRISFVVLFFLLPSFASLMAAEKLTILPKTEITKNTVKFTLDIRTLEGQVVSELPKLRPSGNQKPRYLYVWTFGDHSAPQRTEEPTIIYTYPEASCSYLAKVELTSVKSSDDELSITSKPITVDIQESTQESYSPTEVNMLGSEWLFMDISRFPRVGQEITYFVTYSNPNSPRDLSGQITFKYPKTYQYLYPPNNITCTDLADGSCLYQANVDEELHEITYEFDKLPKNAQKTLALTFKVKENVPLRTALACHASMQIDQTDAIHTACNVRKAVGSWDPNRKEVDRITICTQEENTLTYTIFFENEGSAEAENVTIKDQISPFLDMTTLSVIAESHLSSPPEINLQNREVTFCFNAINLPGHEQEGYRYNFEASRGFITYTIQLQQNAIADIARNASFGTPAQIVFHGQPAIATDPALTQRYCFETNCEVIANSTSKGYLKNFALNTIDNESGDDSGYGDYSFMATSLIAGKTYDLSLIADFLPNGYNQNAHYKIWIDYNQNGNFENTDEELFDNNSSVTVFHDHVKKWDRTFGGGASDVVLNVEQIPNQEYVMVGATLSDFGYEKTQLSKGGQDGWIVKVNKSGNKLWDKVFGGNGGESITGITSTDNNSFILSGLSNSGISGDKTEENKGHYDYWIIKIDENGNKIWDKTFGGDNSDTPHEIRKTIDGNYIIGGSSRSGISGDKSETRFGGSDFWVVKIDKDGNKIWDRTFGGSRNDILWTLFATSDNHYLLGGYSASDITGNKTTTNRGGWDCWLIKIDENGNKIWDKTFGGNYNDLLYEVQENDDGDYILGNWSATGINGDKTEHSRGHYDYWLIKIDTNGNKIWDRTFGGSGADNLMTLTQTNDRGYILGGISLSEVNGDKTENSRGDYDYWIVKIDKDGNKKWDKTLGGEANDYIRNIFQTNENKIIIAGYSDSGFDNDKSDFGRGESDFWLMDLTPVTAEAATESVQRSTFTIPPTALPGKTALRIAMQYDAPPNSCQQPDFGEIEEYTINIIPAFPDLIVEDFQVAQEDVSIGGELALEWEMENIGVEAIGGNHQVQVILSEDALLDEEDRILAVENVGSLQVNQSTNRALQVAIPTDIAAGTYHLLVIGDANQQITESNEHNNYRYAEILIKSSEDRADLKLQTAAVYPLTVQAANPIRISSFVQNLGGREVESYDLTAYLSIDAVWDRENDIELEGFEVDTLKSGKEDFQSEILTIPLQTAAGDYYLIWVADAEDEIEEINENNNWVALPLEVTASAPDLIIEHSFLQPNVVIDGGNITLIHQVLNQGSSAAGSHSYVEYYLSNIVCETEEGIYLGEHYTHNLTGNSQSEVIQKKLTLPQPLEAGTYYLRVKADALQYVAEANEDNNVLLIPITITKQPCLSPHIEKLYLAESEAIPTAASLGNLYSQTFTICGGTLPYDTEFSASGSALNSFEQIPSTSIGCSKYLIRYYPTNDWSLFVTNETGCSPDVLHLTKEDVLPAEQIYIFSLQKSPETCAGDKDGSIEVEAMGGTTDCATPYTYQWYSTNGFSTTTHEAKIEDLATGFYYVTVSDCAGNTAVEDAYLGRTNGGNGGRGRGRSNNCNGSAQKQAFDDFILANLQVHPNPVQATAMISFALPQTMNSRLQLYDMKGQLVHTLFKGAVEKEQVYKISLDTDNLESGIYLLQLTTEQGKVYHQKFLKL